MSWGCSGKTNAELIRNLKHAKIITVAAVERAMLSVDRRHYVKAGQDAYADRPLRIGCNVTISAPHMHAYALEMLSGHLQEGMKALDVGSGSGYLTACMPEMVGPSGHVVGIDHIEELVEGSLLSVQRDRRDLLDDKRLELLCVDGFDGYKEGGAYNAIHVGAAAPKVPPALVDQLLGGGRMVIPVGPDGGEQYILQVDKDAASGAVTETRVMGVRYVPLTTREKQLGRK